MGGNLTTHSSCVRQRDVGGSQRGEYVYIADGEGASGFDIAQINQKGFSEKIVSAPVSTIGQDTNVKTRYAMAVAAPRHARRRSGAPALQVNEEAGDRTVYATFTSPIVRKAW